MVVVRIADIKDVRSLVEFNQLMAMETEGKKLDDDILTQGVSRLVNDDNKGFYLVAECDSVVVGSLMITTEWSDWRNGVFWWVQSVFVSPSHRRQGIYTKLYEHVKKLSKQKDDVCGYRLYVEKNNEIAQQTYKSLGMRPSHYLMYEE